jgi:hypothetical protein
VSLLPLSIPSTSPLPIALYSSFCWGLDFTEDSCFIFLEVEVEVNLRPTVSRPVRLGIGPPFGTLDQIVSCSSFSADNYLISLPKASSLTRRRVCSLQWNHSLVPITILYCLIWDCVPFLSPLTTRRDYGGSILTRLLGCDASYKHSVRTSHETRYITTGETNWPMVFK